MPRRTSIAERQTFAVEDGWLVRTARRKDGSSYQHRCSLDAYKAVVHYLDDHAEAGVTTNELWDGLPDVPCTQASVALAFLKERGCVEVRRRRCHPVSGILFEDAMIEFHALEA
jgi:hypothetical protein